MLVISRQAGESVIVGDVIEVMVVGTRSDRVTLRASYLKAGGRLSGEIASGEFARDEVMQLDEHGSCEVVDIRGDKVRLAFTCPEKYSVHRKEVWEAIMRENRRNDDDDGLAGSRVPRV